MLISVILFFILLARLIYRKGGLKSWIIQEGGINKAYPPILISLILFILSGYVITTFVGMIYDKMDFLYETNLVNLEIVESYKNESTFSLGFDGKNYTYNVHTDNGVKTDKKHIDNVYIKKVKELNEPYVETYEYKFKYNIVNLFARNLKSTYKVFHLPENYQIIDIKRIVS